MLKYEVMYAQTHPHCAFREEKAENKKDRGLNEKLNKLMGKNGVVAIESSGWLRVDGLRV
jgi:hypothetical protein